MLIVKNGNKQSFHFRSMSYPSATYVVL